MSYITHEEHKALTERMILVETILEEADFRDYLLITAFIKLARRTANDNLVGAVLTGPGNRPIVPPTDLDTDNGVYQAVLNEMTEEEKAKYWKKVNALNELRRLKALRLAKKQKEKDAANKKFGGGPKV